MRGSVYLAGPVSGKSPEAARSWRAAAARTLGDAVHIIDPLRDEADFSQVSGEISGDDILHARRCVQRDMFDVARCDVVLANFLEAQSVSIGTLAEVFWAHAFGKLIVVAIEPEANPNRHPFVDAVSPWVFQDIDSAISKVRVLVGST